MDYATLNFSHSRCNQVFTPPSVFKIWKVTESVNHEAGTQVIFRPSVTTHGLRYTELLTFNMQAGVYTAQCFQDLESIVPCSPPQQADRIALPVFGTSLD